MICGTMIFEDTSIQWALVDDGQVEYVVQDGLQGYTAKVACTDMQFAAAMALALGGDEIAGASALYPLAEQAMPRKEHLPDREGMNASGLEGVLHAVRWIP